MGGWGGGGQAGGKYTVSREACSPPDENLTELNSKRFYSF